METKDTYVDPYMEYAAGFQAINWALLLATLILIGTIMLKGCA